MKVQGNGQARVLTGEEIQRLFADGLSCDRDRALFGLCLYTGCRISEALTLQVDDLQGDILTLRRRNTKGKLQTRSLHIHPVLANLLAAYAPASGYLFPGMPGRSPHLTRFSADKILRAACRRVGLQGISTHSFRRTALTTMSNAGIPLRHIQDISGHRSLATLQRYLEVRPEDRQRAIASLRF
ncbi:MAG TPA: site-specific integrase [Candidatus Obscuribacterales bacterium]